MFEYLQKLSQSVLSALGLQSKSQFIMQRCNLNLYLLMKKKNLSGSESSEVVTYHLICLHFYECID